jgi:hypothetical protein
MGSDLRATIPGVRCATAASSDDCDYGAPSVAFGSWRLPGEARPSLSSILIPLQSPLCASFDLYYRLMDYNCVPMVLFFLEHNFTCHCIKKKKAEER